MLTVGSLFAGIGGFDLGFERAGFEIKWQCEIDPFARAVLATHWPNVTRYEDVRTLSNPEPVDVLCGGFPCQDISDAGKRAGIEAERSGLWREFARLVGEIRPRYVVVENVAALLDRGMGRVIGDLAALGYDAEWDVVSACAAGAPHVRERVFIVAYPDGLAGAEAYSRARAIGAQRHARSDDGGRYWNGRAATHREICKSDVLRMADGVSARVDRCDALGNAIVPQIAQFIAERIKAWEEMNAANTAECR